LAEVSPVRWEERGLRRSISMLVAQAGGQVSSPSAERVVMLSIMEIIATQTLMALAAVVPELVRVLRRHLAVEVKTE